MGVKEGLVCLGHVEQGFDLVAVLAVGCALGLELRHCGGHVPVELVGVGLGCVYHGLEVILNVSLELLNIGNRGERIGACLDLSLVLRVLVLFFALGGGIGRSIGVGALGISGGGIGRGVRGGFGICGGAVGGLGGIGRCGGVG